MKIREKPGKKGQVGKFAGRVVYACSPLPLGWVARHHDTYLTQKLRNTHLICITMKSGDEQDKLPIRSTAGERVKNKETPAKIVSVGRYALNNGHQHYIPNKLS